MRCCFSQWDIAEQLLGSALLITASKISTQSARGDICDITTNSDVREELECDRRRPLRACASGEGSAETCVDRRRGMQKQPAQRRSCENTEPAYTAQGSHQRTGTLNTCICQETNQTTWAYFFYANENLESFQEIFRCWFHTFVNKRNHKPLHRITSGWSVKCRKQCNAAAKHPFCGPQRSFN